MPADAGVERGCGSAREEGGLYLEVGLSSVGAPFDSFILDPITPMHPDDLTAIPHLGVTLVEGPDGIVHVIDWVGETHYPLATDFLEEGRRKGFSRKISKLVEINRLTPGKSMIYFLHARAYLANHALYTAAEYEHRGRPKRMCRWPADKAPLCARLDPGHCRRHLWAAATPTSGSKASINGPYTQQWRQFVDFDYQVYPPTEAIPPDWKAAYVARFPITNFTVIRARDGSHAHATKSATSRSRYPVMEADS